MNLFTDISDSGLEGVFGESSADKIIEIVERVNKNARAVG